MPPKKQATADEYRGETELDGGRRELWRAPLRAAGRSDSDRLSRRGAAGATCWSSPRSPSPPERRWR